MKWATKEDYLALQLFLLIGIVAVIVLILNGC